MKRERHIPGGRTNIRIVLKQNPGELETQLTSPEPTEGHKCPWWSVQVGRDMAGAQAIETIHHSFTPLKKCLQWSFPTFIWFSFLLIARYE